jgi:hypothetical protein
MRSATTESNCHPSFSVSVASTGLKLTVGRHLCQQQLTPVETTPRAAVQPVGARHDLPVFAACLEGRRKLQKAVSVFPLLQVNTVSLSPLYATLTKNQAGPFHTRGSSTILCRGAACCAINAQASNPPAPAATHSVGARQPVPAFPAAPTPTVSLTPLFATLTKNGGVPVEP